MLSKQLNDFTYSNLMYCNVVWANTYPSRLLGLLKLQKWNCKNMFNVSLRILTTHLNGWLWVLMLMHYYSVYKLYFKYSPLNSSFATATVFTSTLLIFPGTYNIQALLFNRFLTFYLIFYMNWESLRHAHLYMYYNCMYYFLFYMYVYIL